MKKGIFLCSLIALSTGFVGGKIISEKSSTKEYKELKERMAKFEEYFAVTNKWLKNRNCNISVVDYFRENNYEKIAIYGMGEIGKRLYEELKNEGIEVEYVFDRSAQRVDPALRVCSLEGPVPPADIVVVTPLFDYAIIEEQLKKIVNCKIVPISEIVNR